ncbi:MAG: type II toxin-antitoxin system RelE/ParE family toxin [Flavobacterium sp.]
MYKSIILPHAKEDIREAATWYNKKRDGLGKKFTADVRETVRYIKQNPAAFNIRYDKVSTAVLAVFPYMIHFTFDETNKTVVASAVIHTSRDQELWRKR